MTGNGVPPPRDTTAAYRAEVEATRTQHPDWTEEALERRALETLTGRKEPLARR